MPPASAALSRRWCSARSLTHHLTPHPPIHCVAALLLCLSAALLLCCFSDLLFAICSLPFPMSTLNCPLPTVAPPSAPRLRARVPNELPPIPPELQTPASPLKTQDSRLTPLLNLFTRLGFSVRQLAVACDLGATDLLEFLEDPDIDNKLDRLEAVLERTLRLRLLDSAITAADELEKIAITATEHPTERRRAATTILRAATAPSSPKPRVSAPQDSGLKTQPPSPSSSPTQPPPQDSGLKTQAPPPPTQPPPQDSRLRTHPSPPLTSPSAARSPAGSPQPRQPCGPSSARAARPPPARPPPPVRAQTRSA